MDAEKMVVKVSYSPYYCKWVAGVYGTSKHGVPRTVLLAAKQFETEEEAIASAARFTITRDGVLR